MEEMGPGMKEQIEKLLTLQGLDLRIADLEGMLESLPGEVEAAAGERLALERELAAKRADIEAETLKRRRLEGDLEGNSEEIAKFSVQLNEVKTNEQYNALLKEIDDRKKKNSAIEEEILLGMDRGEKLEKECDALSVDVKRAAEKEKEERSRVEKELEEVWKDLVKAKEERSVAAAALEPKTLSRYEQIHGRSRTQAVARIDREACEVCYRRIPAQRIIEVKRMKALVSCEGCGRILVWTG